MSRGESRLSRRVSRRRILRAASGAAAALAAAVTGGTSAAKGPAPTEVCFWRKVNSVCDNGQLMERWCYVCCAGIDCETFFCEWRPAGSC